MSNKEIKAARRRAYRGMWPNASATRHRHREGVSGSLRAGKVFLWDNGAVTAFNNKGELIGDLCGLYHSVRHVILKRLHLSTAFFRCGDWQQEPHTGISLDEFKAVA